MEYKHAFREVIAGEIAKSPYLQFYYDEWGNRAYIFTAEKDSSYIVYKNSVPYEELDLNTKALSDLGCAFLFAAAPIQNADALGLSLLRETSYQTEQSYYGIYVYRILTE